MLTLTAAEVKAVKDLQAYCDVTRLVELLNDRVFKYINKRAFAPEQNEDVICLKRFMDEINSDSSQTNSGA